MLYHWTNLRYGSFYSAMYTAVMHILFIFYAIYAVSGGRTDYFFSPYFELTLKGTQVAAGLTIIFALLFLLFTVMLVIGVKRVSEFSVALYILHKGYSLFVADFSRRPRVPFYTLDYLPFHFYITYRPVLS